MKKQQIIDKVNSLIAVANSHYNITLPPIDIRFDLRGKSAGQAKCTYHGFLNTTSNHVLRFNIDMINNDSFDHILNETVPHELAHTICYHTRWGKNHDKTWQKICVFLGGNGQRCHTEEITPARITEKYLYKTTCGRIIQVGKVRHNRIQKGIIYRTDQGGHVIRESWSRLTPSF